MTQDERPPIDILWDITNAVCGTNYTRQKVSRKQAEVKVRHIFWTVANEQLNHSLVELAVYCHVGNHTSVLSGIKRVRRAQQLTPLRLPTEPDVATAYWQVSKAFKEEINVGLDLITIPKWPTLAYL